MKEHNKGEKEEPKKPETHKKYQQDRPKSNHMNSYIKFESTVNSNQKAEIVRWIKYKDPSMCYPKDPSMCYPQQCNLE